MEKKLHIKGIAGINLKIDAMWYHYGEKFDCYMTPQQFKDCVAGLIDFDIILDDDNSHFSTDIPKNIIIEGEVKEDDTQIRESNENKPSSKGTKKTSVQRK